MAESRRLVKKNPARTIWGSVTVTLGFIFLFCVTSAFTVLSGEGFEALFGFVYLAIAVGVGILGLISLTVWRTREGHVYEVVVEPTPTQRVTTDPSTAQPEPDR